MKHIGNYASWIQQEWIHELLLTEGQARPRDWPAAFTVESEEYTRAAQAGYDLTQVLWWLYEQKNVSFDIVPPWTTRQCHWWITKLYPGQYMPMHTDPHTHERSCNRYWMPLQDYHPGHVFIYENELVKDYKKGDVYSYISSQDMHGAANIGHIPRLILQVTEYI